MPVLKAYVITPLISLPLTERRTRSPKVGFLLADISVKLDLRFPYLIKDRIKAAKRIDEGSYEVYKDDLDRMCDELLRFEDSRHFMSHGFLSLTIDKEGNSLGLLGHKDHQRWRAACLPDP